MANAAADTETTGPARRRRVLLVVGVVAALLIGAAVWIGVRGWLAKGELEHVEALKDSFSTAVRDGDAQALGSSVSTANTHAATAASLASDPLWRMSEALPFWGANAAALRVAAESVRDVTGAAQPLFDRAAAVTASSSNGLDISLVGELADPLAATSRAVDAANTNLSALDSGALLPPLRDAVVDLRSTIDGAAAPLSDAATAASVLPEILGADDPRSILIMVQNTAEARTGGGITGSFVELRASKGKIEFGNTADSTDFDEQSADILPIPATTTALYDDKVGRFVTNTTMTADFDLSARLASAWWQKLGHPAPDTVISIDPVVLAALLKITGPITLADGGSVDATTVTERILVRPYLEDSQEGQTAVQSDLTMRLFDRLINEPLDVAAWAEALADPVEDGRISMWSARANEQDALAHGPFGGTLARYVAAGDQAIGVYLNDASTGKLGTFLHLDIAVGERVCREDGVAEVTVATTLTSTAPEAARHFPLWMTGGDNPSQPGDLTTDVTVEAPAGWFTNGAEINGALNPSTDVADGEHAQTRTRVVVAPGQSQTVTFHLPADLDGAEPAPAVVHTPLLNPVGVKTGDTLPCD